MNLLIQLNGNVLADTVSPVSLNPDTEPSFAGAGFFANLFSSQSMPKNYDEIAVEQSVATNPTIGGSEFDGSFPIGLSMANSNSDGESLDNLTEVSEPSELLISDSNLKKLDNASDFQKLDRQISGFLTNAVAGENFPASSDRQRELGSIVRTPPKSDGERSHVFAGNCRLLPEVGNIAVRLEQSSVGQIQSHQLGEDVGTKFSSRISQILSSATVYVPENHDLNQNLERVITFQPADEPERLGSLPISGSDSVKPSDIFRLNVSQPGWMSDLSAKIVMLQSSNDSLMLKLKPSNLGMVRVEVVNHENIQSVSLFTETDSARSIMMSAQPRLEAELRLHSQKTVLVDVNVQTSSGGSDDTLKERGQRGPQILDYGANEMQKSESKSSEVVLSHLLPTRLA